MKQPGSKFKSVTLVFVILVSLILVAGMLAQYFLAPAFGASEEALNGDGSMDTSLQVAAWELVNKTGVSSWSLDDTVFYSGLASGRLDSPIGAGLSFESYVYKIFTTNKVPVSAALSLAYKKQFTGIQPVDGNWSVAAEIWEIGGEAPLQVIDINSITSGNEFTALTNVSLPSVTKPFTNYELRLVQKGQTGDDVSSMLTTWFDEVKIDITYDSTSPEVVSVDVPSDHYVDVYFNEALDKISAETTVNYVIQEGLAVTGAALLEDGKTVRLTTATQTRDAQYTLEIQKVTDISGNELALVQLSFTGVDTTPPKVLTAEAVTDTAVNIKFSEPVDQITAQQTDNYSISPSLQVFEAIVQPDGLTVKLNTARQSTGTGYTVTVVNVTDQAGNVIAAENMVEFTGIDTSPPELVSATPINDTLLNLLFSEPLDSQTAQDTANYSISPQLAINGAVIQADGKTVQLNTSRQSWQVDYSITVIGIMDQHSNVMTDPDTSTFTGLDSTPPQITSVVSVDERTVDVVFNEAVDAVTAQTLVNYSITPSLSIGSAVLQSDGKTVRLTTGIQAYMTTYTLTVTGVTDLAGNMIEGNESFSFLGTDTTGTSVLSAAAINYNTVDIVFSEMLESVSAQTISNYQISNSLIVKKAVLQPDGTTVRLTTSPQTGGVNYTVTATGVEDLAGNPVGSVNTADFSGISPPVTTPLKVLSATAPHNTAVAVVFSATLDPLSAQNPANYVISPSISVTSALLQGDGLTVRLSTSTQESGVLYTVTVTGVSDQYGNVTGDDNNTASFNGSEIISTNPHGRYLTDTNKCAQCHVTHSGSGPGLINQSSQTQLCYLCHDAGGQSQYDVANQFALGGGNQGSNHKVPEGEQECTDCHNPHDGGQDIDGNEIHYPRLLQSRADSSHGDNQFCFSCHVNTQTNTRVISPDLYPIDGIGHNNASFVINGATPFNPASGTNIRCLGCHRQHGASNPKLVSDDPNNDQIEISDEAKSLCYECHKLASADGRFPGQSVYDNYLKNPHSLSVSLNTQVSYPGMTGTAGQCINCHDPHGTSYGTSQVSMKTLRGVFNDGKRLYTASDFTFCFGCHNNSSANAKYDIQTPYNNSTGGHSINSSGGSLDPGSKLPCATCHSLHGSANNNKYMLSNTLGDNLGDGRNECLACHRSGKTVEGIAMSAPSSSVPEHTGTAVACLFCHGSAHSPSIN